MKRKKILALLMVAALCVGTVAGCGSKDTESSKSESSKNENSESSTGDSKDDLSPITFKYYNADGKNGNWENPVAQAITEATGVTLDISYPVSSTGDPDEVRATIRCVTINISVTVIFAAREVSFTMAIRELESGGNAVRIACGRIILRMICRYDMPTQ